MSQPLLSARDVCQSFPVIGEQKLEVLRGISLDLFHGESAFLVGASGAGKTTLLYTLAGLERPKSGIIEFEGRPLYKGISAKAQARQRNERMGFIFQAYCLLPELTALENVRLPMMLTKGAKALSSKAQDERAKLLLEEVGLSHRGNHRPVELSGGEQQRVAIARALANDPSIIFADEPTGNLDSKSGTAVMELLLSFVAKNSKTLLVVTHDLHLAVQGDRKLEMKDGRLQ